LTLVATPDDHVIVIFGATGDLARRKLLPALYHLAEAGLMPRRYRIVASSRDDLGDDEFRGFARKALEEFCRCAVREKTWNELSGALAYVPGAYGPDSAEPLVEAVRQAEQALGGEQRKLLYLAVPPAAFGPIAEGLESTGLADGARVILEKPFGTDLDSARVLNETLHGVFAEEQVFRIDHFLGKETVQNILALRFANGIFEPIWNRDHIDHVQIDVPEELGIGTRAGFYEATGALRDMVVTHLFQVLSFVAMDPPAALEPKPLVDEKVEVFEAMVPLRPDDVVRGQFEGYRDEDGVTSDSETETFVAGRVFIDNLRWAGVPFYFRTGKRMAQGRRTVTIAFREPPWEMFEISDVRTEPFEPDHLTLELGPPEGISMTFLAKRPGPVIELGQARMEFRYEGSFGGELVEAYERLLHDAMLGDHTLFTRADGIERLWEVVTPVLDDPPALDRYVPGSWGPERVHELIAPRRWHLPAGHA
jgi:glucose-6-phosphate 1-dehydrogenase